MVHERRTVLVVEDEPLLRLMAVDLVRDAGLEPLEAADATEAVRILESRSDIRVVFTDIDMPRGMDGLQLAAAVHDRWPPIGIIVTSGHLKPEMSALPACSVFFAKPYRRLEVVRTLHRMAA